MSRIAIMVGPAKMKGAGADDSADSDESAPGGDEKDSADEATKEELGTAVAEALTAKDPKALYQAICDIVRYEHA